MKNNNGIKGGSNSVPAGTYVWKDDNGDQYMVKVGKPEKDRKQREPQCALTLNTACIKSPGVP